MVVADDLAPDRTGLTPLGRKVRAWRLDRRMILIEMAILLGVRPHELSGWETGCQPWPPGVAQRLRVLTDPARHPVATLDEYASDEAADG